MKKTIFILFFSFFLITNLSANEVIAYIDMDKILNLSKVGQKAVLDLENNHKKKIESFKKIEEKLKKKEREIISQKNILSNDEYEKKINDLRQEVRNYRKKDKSPWML